MRAALRKIFLLWAAAKGKAAGRVCYLGEEKPAGELCWIASSPLLFGGGSVFPSVFPNKIPTKIRIAFVGKRA